jgi:hypothetical protein
MYEEVMVQLRAFLDSARDKIQMVSFMPPAALSPQKDPLHPLYRRLVVLEICERSAENENHYLCCESRIEISPQHIDYTN